MTACAYYALFLLPTTVATRQPRVCVHVRVSALPIPRAPNLISAMVHAATLESLMLLARPGSAPAAVAAVADEGSSSAAQLAAFTAHAKAVLDKAKSAMLLTAEAGKAPPCVRSRARACVRASSHGQRVGLMQGAR